MNHRKAAETFHPGIFIEEELDERGWSQLDLAEILGKSPRDINFLINGKLSVTPKTAIGLAEAFDTNPQLWMNLESSYQLSLAQRETSDVALKAKLYEKFPVREMIKRHWIKPSTNIEVLVRRFCEFFEISSLDDAVEFNCAFRKSTSYNENNLYQCAWFYRAKKLASACLIEQKFSQAKLKKSLEKLRLLLHEPLEVRHVPRIMKEAGIRFIIVEAMPKSKIDGATFWLDSNSPVVVLSLRLDRIDNFWFTLMHELSHVRNEDKKDGVILDIDLLGEGDSVKPPYEIRADNESAEFLIPSTELDNFIQRVQPYYLEWKIQAFALNIKVHAGIVVGQLHHRFTDTGRGLPYTHLRKLLEKVRHNIIETAFTDGYGYVPSV
jgi:HTH-type transcriptional regulator/antitoxin HigA